MEHLLNLRAVAAKAAPDQNSKSWFYQRLNSMMRGEVGNMSAEELDALAKVLKAHNAEVMAHIKDIRKRTKKKAA